MVQAGDEPMRKTLPLLSMRVNSRRPSSVSAGASSLLPVPRSSGGQLPLVELVGVQVARCRGGERVELGRVVEAELDPAPDDAQLRGPVSPGALLRKPRRS